MHTAIVVWNDQTLKDDKRLREIIRNQASWLKLHITCATNYSPDQSAHELFVYKGAICL